MPIIFGYNTKLFTTPHLWNEIAKVIFLHVCYSKSIQKGFSRCSVWGSSNIRYVEETVLHATDMQYLRLVIAETCALGGC